MIGHSQFPVSLFDLFLLRTSLDVQNSVEILLPILVVQFFEGLYFFLVKLGVVRVYFFQFLIVEDGRHVVLFFDIVAGPFLSDVDVKRIELNGFVEVVLGLVLGVYSAIDDGPFEAEERVCQPVERVDLQAFCEDLDGLCVFLVLDEQAALLEAEVSLIDLRFKLAKGVTSRKQVLSLLYQLLVGLLLTQVVVQLYFEAENLRGCFVLVQRFENDLAASQLPTPQQAFKLLQSQLVCVVIEGKPADQFVYALSGAFIVLLRFQVHVSAVESVDCLHRVDNGSQSWLVFHGPQLVRAFGNFGKVVSIQVDFRLDYHHLSRCDFGFVHVFEADFILAQLVEALNLPFEGLHVVGEMLERE